MAKISIKREKKTSSLDRKLLKKVVSEVYAATPKKVAGENTTVIVTKKASRAKKRA